MSNPSTENSHVQSDPLLPQTPPLRLPPLPEVPAPFVVEPVPVTEPSPVLPAVPLIDSDFFNGPVGVSPVAAPPVESAPASGYMPPEEKWEIPPPAPPAPAPEPAPAAPSNPDPPPAQQKVMKICITPGCALPSRARGLCANCYSAARLRVSSQRDTWEELEAVGLALPAGKRGRQLKSGPGGSSYQMELDAALQKQATVAREDQRREEFVAAFVTPQPERVVDAPVTTVDLSAAAAAVGQNPSAENLAVLSELMKRSNPPPMASPAAPLVAETAELPKLASGLVYQETPTGPEIRVQSQEELVMAARKAAMEKASKLRKKSLSDARINSEGEAPEVVDEGDPDATGMSDEEFNRIRDAYLIRTGKKAQPAPPIVQPTGLPPVPPPQFPEQSELTDVSYDSSLDSGTGSGMVASNLGDIDSAIDAFEAAAEGGK